MLEHMDHVRGCFTWFVCASGSQFKCCFFSPYCCCWKHSSMSCTYEENECCGLVVLCYSLLKNRLQIYNIIQQNRFESALKGFGYIIVVVLIPGEMHSQTFLFICRDLSVRQEKKKTLAFSWQRFRRWRADIYQRWIYHLVLVWSI